MLKTLSLFPLLTCLEDWKNKFKDISMQIMLIYAEILAYVNQVIHQWCYCKYLSSVLLILTLYKLIINHVSCSLKAVRDLV